MSFNLPPRPLLLRRANFNQQVTARQEMRRRFGDQAIENREAVRAAVQRLMRLVIAHARRQLGKILAGDVRRIAEDEIEAFAAWNRSEQIALHKADAFGDTML